MTMLDCIIAGGLLVDGTGRPAVRADVGIRDGRVVAIGKQDESAKRVIDADGQVVAPGFVDVHTHYDAQVMWDAAVSPSSLHGVTTVIGGNCGFTIAPVSDDSADYVMRMLACVEGMPVESLEAMLDFRWKSFADWLARLEGRLAINTGFLAGHSTIRKLVMGEAWQEAASLEHLEQMKAVLDESLQGGALGFSSSWGSTHGDHLGNPVPSRFATEDELIALASVLHSHSGTMLEFLPPREWSPDVIDLMITMSVEAGSSLNWNLLMVGTDTDRAQNQARLAVADRAAERGGEIIALSVPMPMQLRVNLLSTILYNRMPIWQQVLTLPVDERIRALSDPSTRQRMAAAVEPSPLMQFDRMTVLSVVSPGLKDYEGRVVGDLASERGVTALDMFLDIAVADDLLTCFQSPPLGDDAESWRERGELWQDPRVLIGGSDAGAHLDMLSTFGFFTDFVGPTVRDRELLGLEDAVHKITDAPSRLYGLRDRGRIAQDFRADIVIFDPETVRNDKVVLRDDMPNHNYRLFADAIGIQHVLVNGVEIVDQGQLTGATPGTVLRSGRDTETPTR